MLSYLADTTLAFSDIDVDLIEAFLTDLEQRRGIGARSRNLRLSAIRSYFRYAAYYEPAHVARIQQISWLSPPNVMIARWWVFSADRKWRPSLQLRICAPGAAGGITHYYSSLSRRACVCPN